MCSVILSPTFRLATEAGGKCTRSDMPPASAALTVPNARQRPTAAVETMILGRNFMMILRAGGRPEPRVRPVATLQQAEPAPAHVQERLRSTGGARHRPSILG